MARASRQYSGIDKRAHEPECVGRIHLFRVAVIFFALLLLGRLFQIQIRDGDKWTALAADQHTLSQALKANRGDVALREGDGISPVAVNREYKLVYVVPREIDDVPGTSLALSSVLGVSESDIRDRISRREDDPFEVIKKRVPDDEVNRLKELNLKGVHFLPEIYRYYPAGELASKVVGFVGPGDGGDIGVYGIEASWNGALQGLDGRISQEQDSAGRWIPLTDREHVEAVDGESVVLTIDRVVQYEVERILKSALEKYQAAQATAIVMEPATGKILAMSTVPQFNPNEYSSVEDLQLFMNPAVSLPYEAGSVIKPLTMAIGLEERKVSPTSEYIDTGVVTEVGYNIRNAEDKVYGKSSMTKVLEESINTGVIYVERQVGNERFREFLRKFGFGEKTGVRLPAEHPGNIRNLSNLRSNINFYTASFGQGISVTPIQLVNAFATLANGGVRMQPQIVDRIIHADGTIEPVIAQEKVRAVSQETAGMIGSMLRSVVVNGHGKRADVPGYLVVGKTGTAQVAKGDSRGYEEGTNIGSFVGYAPLQEPRYAVLVKIDNPKDVEWAESSAAPTFGEIMRFLMNYGKVQPTEKISEK